MGSPMWHAHSLETDKSKAAWQPLAEHLIAVEGLARARAEKFGAGPAGALAGLLHDLGKYTRAFQTRLEGGGAVDHAAAGAEMIKRLAAQADERCIAEILAHAIAGHHSGLPDSLRLDERIKKPRPALDPAWRTEISPVAEGLTPAFLTRAGRADRLAFQRRLSALVLEVMSRRGGASRCRCW